MWMDHGEPRALARAAASFHSARPLGRLPRGRSPARRPGPLVFSHAFMMRSTKVHFLRAFAAAGGKVVTVEDHYEHGGIGDAVLSALADEKVTVRKLAVREIARSGKPEELLHMFGIDSQAIVKAVEAAVGS